MPLKIEKKFKEFIVNHAKKTMPNEACGIVHSINAMPTSIYEVTNIAHSPYRYEMDGIEQLNLEKKREKNGEDLFAIYHSHVATKAEPSPTDVRMAFFPPGNFKADPMFDSIYYILISLEHTEADVRFFKIEKGPIVKEIDVLFN